MKYRTAILLCLLLFTLPLLSLAGCARDVNDPDVEDPFPVEARIAMRTRGVFDAQTWYYMVFNFTSAPSTVLANNPIDRISNEDRAQEWELYVAYNRNAEGVETLVTLQQPNVPTVLPTARGPVDAATGDYTGDTLVDVAVACKLDDVVQVLVGAAPAVINPVYFEDARTIENANGDAPLRLHTEEMNGVAGVDMLVIYEGSDGASFYRFLPGDPDNDDFLAGTDVPLPATVVDAVFPDMNGDTEVDMVMITRGDTAAENTLRVFLGDGAGNFTESDVQQIDSNPRTVQSGQLNDGGLDLVVADGGTGGTGNVLVFTGDGDGTLTAGPELPVEGTLRCASIGTMFGSNGDILVAFDDAQGQGAVAVFQNEAATPFQVPAVGVTLGASPTYVLFHEAGGDAEGDAILVDGDASGGQTLYIQRGDRIDGANIGDPATFAWNLETITYLTGVGPSRIHLADLDQNSTIDFVIPNTADVNGGNSVSLCYGLGRYNYTNADIFWTDDQPSLLTAQEWYISHLIGPNFFELTIDPALFFDLARLPPSRENGFNVQMMTGTTGIDIESNPDQLGEVEDFLSAAINVQMRIDFYNDEFNLPLASQNIASLDSQDIDHWVVEVQ